MVLSHWHQGSIDFYGMPENCRVLTNVRTIPPQSKRRRQYGKILPEARRAEGSIRKTGSSRFVENIHIFVIFFYSVHVQSVIDLFNHVASPVNCINCTVINPTVGKESPNFRDLFGSLLGPYLYFSVFAKFTRRMSIQSACTQQ